MAQLGIRSNSQLTIRFAAHITANGRAARQLTRQLLTKKVTQRAIAGGITFFAHGMTFAAELATFSAPVGENSDCVGCLVHYMKR